MNAPNRSPIDTVRIFTSAKAGRGQDRDQLKVLQQLLVDAGIDVAIIKTPAELLAWSANAPVIGRAIVTAGGDGTLSLAASIAPSGMPLLPMPMGTENLLARHFGFAADATLVHHSIMTNQTMVIDAGTANGKLFLVMVTAGFDAEVVRAMHLRRRGHIRRFNYAGPILRAIRRYRFPLITANVIDQSGSAESTSGCWMMAFNCPRYAASLRIESTADPTDGALNLMSFKRPGIISGLGYLARIAIGRHRGHRDVLTRKLTASNWHSPSRVPFQIDGDYAGHLPVKIETVPAAVTLLRPASNR
ncbi:MAG: diacylglycerol kinase family protein [Planctomycetota bacterium]